MRRALLLAAVLLLAVPVGAQAITTRVIGGVVAQEGEWPFAVALETTFGAQFCDGTLVASQWVLTAGHCRLYPAAQVRAVTGTTDLDGTTGQRIGVARQIRHPGYRQIVPGAPRNDLMLVRLAEPSASQPIAFAARGEGSQAGTLLRVAGWGATSYNPVNDAYGPPSQFLRQVLVRVRPPVDCVRAYGAEAFFSDDMVCASLPGRDACAGDSGGPLVEGLGPAALLVGVVSWGTGCAMPRYPGVYSLVARHHCWIDSLIVPPVAPSAIAVAEGDGTLTVNWAWSGACPEAADPTGFRVRIAETGAVLDIGGDTRRAVFQGLANGQPVTITVAGLNENGEGAAVQTTGTPSPNPVTEQRVTWTGYRTARVAFTLAPHDAEVRWRAEAGHALRFRAGPWRTAPADGAPQALAEAVDGLPVGETVDVRIVVAAATTTASERTQLPKPLVPAPITRPQLTGRAEPGGTLRCLLGRWSGTRPFAIDRQWLRDGRRIAGATRATLAVTGALVGTEIACRVTVAGPGGITKARSAPVAVG